MEVQLRKIAGLSASDLWAFLWFTLEKMAKTGGNGQNV
jgi:hypothetical protein